MTPKLPREPLQKILALALEGEQPAKRQQIKASFQRVCRDWRACSNWWTEIQVVGPDKLDHLVAALIATSATPWGQPLVFKIASLHVDLRGSFDRATVLRNQVNFDRLLLRTTHLERLELVFGPESVVPIDLITRRGMNEWAEDHFGAAIVPALANLRMLKHFSFDAPPWSWYDDCLACHSIQRSVCASTALTHDRRH